MPEYLYECQTHGVVSVVKPMAQAGRVERCWECMQFGHDLDADFAPMRRLYTGQNFIMRPSGWNLSPDDPKYSSRLSFARERELGEIRTITSASQDRTIMREVAEERWPTPPESIWRKADERGMQQISEWCQANADHVGEE